MRKVAAMMMKGKCKEPLMTMQVGELLVFHGDHDWFSIEIQESRSGATSAHSPSTDVDLD
jgi:hypothetical protein